MATVSETFIENRNRVQPNHANNYDAVHGGNVMKWMDEVGAMSAMRHAGESCLTASIDRMNFIRPVAVGDVVVIRSYVYEVGSTSLKVRLQAFGEDPRTGEREKTTESYFVYVAVDEENRPTDVPALDVETERDEELRAAALKHEDGR
ncbi:acyl-CoA thioester hydrolase [Halarchaeum acidiphilum MH1-52-1]|uniref:Acyl-CoA thioester hydrolase n=1 Tax=Halarchaeum acidiphilum MH1-52-1 TaxID=1261545 RepID=U3A5V6_9EURY|nr:acyl-CoA thioesterase [Halarchaeum acidiphilum]GAD53044.1 acyl-CoA thioester hydrolase [Halarchaeum acidiphilum MH1-52-1]